MDNLITLIYIYTDNTERNFGMSLIYHLLWRYFRVNYTLQILLKTDIQISSAMFEYLFLLDSIFIFAFCYV